MKTKFVAPKRLRRGCTVEKVNIADLLMIVLFVSATDDRRIVLVVLAADVCDPNINGGVLPISVSFGADCTVEDTAKCAPNGLSGGFGMIEETTKR